MKRICVVVIVIQTLVAFSNGQTRPSNWDQRRFGPRRFFGEDSDDDGGMGRRNFFGNNFGPSQLFPRRPSSGENEGRGQVPPQIPPPMGQTPDQMGPAGGIQPGSGEAPPPGPNSIGPGMEEAPVGAGQEEAPVPEQPPPQMPGGGVQRPFLGSGPQPPISSRPVLVTDPPIRRVPEQMGPDEGAEPVPVPGAAQAVPRPSMAQPPSPGQTEFINPRQPPMAPSPASPGDEMRPPEEIPGIGSRRPGQPPMTPEAQPPPGQGMGEGEPPMQNPEMDPDQEIRRRRRLLRGQETGPQRPIRQDGDLRRQRPPIGQMRGQSYPPGRQTDTYNRPPRFQMSK